MKLPKQYYKQIEQMARNAKAWFDAHPGVSVKVQFNYTRKIFMIAPISEAVKDHIVSCDERGLELVKALWRWGDDTEPTVNMVKAAIELAKHPAIDLQTALSKKAVTVAPIVCPGCNYSMDQVSSTDATRAKPRPGDVTVCLKCGEVLMFNQDMSVHTLSPVDIKDLDDWHRVSVEKIQTLIRQKRPLG